MRPTRRTAHWPWSAGRVLRPPPHRTARRVRARGRTASGMDRAPPSHPPAGPRHHRRHPEPRGPKRPAVIGCRRPTARAPSAPFPDLTEQRAVLVLGPPLPDPPAGTSTPVRSSPGEAVRKPTAFWNARVSFPSCAPTSSATGCLPAPTTARRYGSPPAPSPGSAPSAIPSSATKRSTPTPARRTVSPRHPGRQPRGQHPGGDQRRGRRHQGRGDGRIRRHLRRTRHSSRRHGRLPPGPRPSCGQTDGRAAALSPCTGSAPSPPTCAVSAPASPTATRPTRHGRCAAARSRPTDAQPPPSAHAHPRRPTPRPRPLRPRTPSAEEPVARHP